MELLHDFFRYYKPTPDILNVAVDDVLDWFHEHDRTNDNPIICEVKQIYDLIPEICNIRGGYVLLNNDKILVGEKEIRFGDKKITPGRKVCGYMKKNLSIAVFVCSSGEHFTDLSRQFNRENDYLKAYIVDCFGSLLAEKMADYIHLQLQLEVAQYGLKITNRYSPGYCNWQLDDQKQLFELLPDNPCRISLTESMLMMPIKSVSGIIGVGNDVEWHKYACDDCQDKNCIYRNIRDK